MLIVHSWWQNFKGNRNPLHENHRSLGSAQHSWALSSSGGLPVFPPLSSWRSSCYGIVPRTLCLSNSCPHLFSSLKGSKKSLTTTQQQRQQQSSHKSVMREMRTLLESSVLSGHFWTISCLFSGIQLEQISWPDYSKESQETACQVVHCEQGQVASTKQSTVSNCSKVSRHSEGSLLKGNWSHILVLKIISHWI